MILSKKDIYYFLMLLLYRSMVKIEPEDNEKNYIYAILFNNPKTIKNEFKSNEELIQCLEYNANVNIVKFNKVKKDVDSKCVS